MNEPVLITFLGRSPKDEHGYRTTRYDFGDGPLAEPLAFFGWALARRIKPHRLVILGTAGSMWDHLFEGDLDLGEALEEERTALMEAVENKSVEEKHLAPLQPALAAHLGCEVQLRLIPYCQNAQEQSELLDIMAACIEPGERVHLDVTHGFRHLPMLALLAALYLRRVRRAQIEQIWYGAYDPDTGGAPVLRLRGLLGYADWLDALARYDQSGDLGVFADLLPEAVGGLLREAAFHESVNRIGQARGCLRRVAGQLAALENDPAARLFLPQLRERIAWAQEDKLYLRQQALARRHLQHGRYLEAVIHAYEAWITRLVQQLGGQPDDPQAREQAREQFDAAEKNISPRTSRYQAWDSLRRLRNALVHGGQPKGSEVQRALDGPQAMQQLLEQIVQTLFGEEV